MATTRKMTQPSVTEISLKSTYLNILLKSPRGRWVKQTESPLWTSHVIAQLVKSISVCMESRNLSPNWNIKWSLFLKIIFFHNRKGFLHISNNTYGCKFPNIHRNLFMKRKINKILRLHTWNRIMYVEIMIKIFHQLQNKCIVLGTGTSHVSYRQIYMAFGTDV